MLRYPFLILILLSLTACPGRVLNSATKRVAEGLSRAVVNQTDVATAQDGLPAYLLVVDGLIESYPENLDVLSAGARLYALYASSFVADTTRAKIMADRGHQYGQRLLCQELNDLCQLVGESFDEFKHELDKTEEADVPVLYIAASAWASWIQAHADDWNAVADVPKVQAMMERVTKLDERHDHGNAHLYLGVLATQLPPNLGGKPEEGMAHFERAIDISEGTNLIAKVLYARQYARLVFERELHDRLLNEVLAAPAEVDGLTLSNMLAKQEAQRLLKTADDFF